MSKLFVSNPLGKLLHYTPFPEPLRLVGKSKQLPCIANCNKTLLVMKKTCSQSVFVKLKCIRLPSDGCLFVM